MKNGTTSVTASLSKEEDNSIVRIQQGIAKNTEDSTGLAGCIPTKSIVIRNLINLGIMTYNRNNNSSRADSLTSRNC